jgi:DNA polymerase III alpha subunit
MVLKLPGRTVNDRGQVIFNEDGLCNILLRGGGISGLYVEYSENIEKFNQLCKQWDHPDDRLQICNPDEISIEEFDRKNQSKWFTPEPYASMDILEFLINKCQNDNQILRVADEMELFEERNMIPVLRFLIFLIDDFRERQIVWGVGRGSSVASYVLYLIGVHRIDSMKFNLNIREFLK